MSEIADSRAPVGGVVLPTSLCICRCPASLLSAFPALQGGGGAEGNREARPLRGSPQPPTAPAPQSHKSFYFLMAEAAFFFFPRATPSTSFIHPPPLSTAHPAPCLVSLPPEHSCISSEKQPRTHSLGNEGKESTDRMLRAGLQSGSRRTFIEGSLSNPSPFLKKNFFPSRE